ncbi:MAG: alpha/beta hydrolase fold domain-containing protein [Myxococcales bacterium]|nr:alpha/beta hydrolase fold domain-containing protein [Myxococcales bacterium]
MGFGPPPATLGGPRPAALRVPADYNPAQPWPLVVLLGGYDYFAADWDGWLGASAYVDELGFALLLPDGRVDSAGSPFWNATDTCCDFDGSGVDDVGYLTALLAEAKAAIHVDAGRVVLIGHSNGGFMAYRMACDAADQVTAVVSLAGSGWLDGARCQPSRPVSVLQAHGTLDDVMPYGGDGDAPGAEVMFARWAARSGCSDGAPVQSATPLELVDDDQAGETTEWAQTGCAQGTDVRLWRMAGADHYPELRWDFTERVLGWALTHPRP